MKKVFLLLTMFLFAFTGVTRANVQQNRDDQVIEQGFEDGLGDWTMNNCHSSSGPTSSYGGNTGNYAFRFYYTTNYPQYLISPELDDNDGVNFTFYAARYSSNYPETFKVGYSSTTNDPTEFTWGSEVTCTTMYGAGAYEEYSYDFPAGTKYVSIACTSNDQFYLFVDDITVTATEPAPAPTPGEIVEVTIGDGTGTTYYFPIDNYFNYSCTEQVYLAEEIGIAGTINSISFYYNYGTAYTASNVTMYMKHVSRTDFTSTTDCEPLEAGDVVWTGDIAPTEAGWYTFTLDTPFEYNGTDNLLVAFFDGTSGYPGTSYTWRQTATTTNMGLRYYSDSSIPDPYNLASYTGSKSFYSYRSNVQLSITTGGGEPTTAFTTIPEVLDLGYRPNGAWMAPYTFAIKSNIGATTINALDFSGNYFTYNAELPATVSANNPLNVELTTGTAEEGLVEGTMTIMYSGNRDIEQHPVTAYAYNPVEGDVYESAIVVPMELQEEVEVLLPEDIYHNYEIPNSDNENDAVYKVTFDQDVLLYAAANGNVAVYTEDFNGEGGPMVDNNYEYNGPTVNPGPQALWFSYDYTGSNTWYGTSAGGGFYFGYKISADFIAANGLAGLTITTVEAAAREAYPYHCYIIEGGADPFEGNMIGGGSIENPTALYFFDINLNMPAYISGNSDIWVIFYSDSPYAAYCGRYPADVNNGKIWTYNPNSTVPAWTSNTNYTPVIYARMLELPTGREVSVDLAKMEVKKGNGAASEIAEVDGGVMNVAKAQIAQNNRGNRDDLVEVTIGDPTSTTTNQYLPGYTLYDYAISQQIYTADEIGVAGTINTLTMWLKNSSSYARNINVYMKETEASVFASTSAWESFTASDMVASFTMPNGNSTPIEVALDLSTPFEYSGTGNLVICFQDVTGSWSSGLGGVEMDAAGNQAIYAYRDGTVYDPSNPGVNGTLLAKKNVIRLGIMTGGTPEPPTPVIPDPIEPTFEPQFTGLMPAGTYYVVATDSVLHMVIDYVPLPEQAVVISPADGETNVEAPYYAEWILGDYTTEMQVLLGTQYPPQTALIDWTDYLVESAFIMELEPNQTYFFQVNERNGSGTTMGEVVAFTTPIDPVEGLEIAESNLYPGDAAVLTWTANARSLKGYNVYVDGVKYNESLITTNAYNVEGLEYNMAGYDIQVSAVYDAGESELSEAVTSYMTGYGSVSGHAYDKPDEDTDAMPIAFATVMFSGSDEYGVNQTFVVETDEEGAFAGEILAGTYTASVITEGYDGNIAVNALVIYNNLTDNIDIYTHEFYYPVGMVTATEQENDVLVEWSWNPAEMVIDFETGDFSQGEFTLPAQYPWAITTTNPHEGTYCMKSTCEGIASGTSSIELAVEVPYDGLMGFWVKVSSESNYDKFHFYIDGVEQGSAMSGALEYQYKEYVVTEGTHVYKFEYAKDSSVNSNDDCVYVDDITVYKQAGPAPSGQSYNFDDGSMGGWTNIDADGDGNVWVMASDAMGSGYGHNASADCVLSKSYDNNIGVLYPDNYLVSPFKMNAQNGAAITFYACAQDASYAAEHFGVAVSTGSNSVAADFTMVQEWTMTAKSIPAAEYNGEVRGTRAQGNWYEFSVDLSSYAGQEIWVAIRHFNCSDMFYLDVDDITLGDGSEAMTRNDRTFQSFNVYRRNNIDEASVENPELLLEGTTEFSYTDTDNINFGEWQWGVQATYEGYAPVPERSRETATFGFEGGLEGWTGIVVNTDGGEWIHSDDNLGGYDYTELAHTGTGFAMCYSFVDYVGSFDTDAYLVSPQKYAVDANSSITFWADNANDSYPENFSVCVSTAANPTASDFTQVWSGGAKGTGNGGAAVRRSDNRYENWRSHEVSLAAYAGQEIWIAFHDVNYDMYEIWIDDVTITYAGGAPVPPTPGPTGSGLSEIIWSNVIEIDMEATVTFNVSLNNGQSPEGATIDIIGANNVYAATVDAEGAAEVVVRKGDDYVIQVSLDGYLGYSELWAADEDTHEVTVVLYEFVGPVEGFYVSPTGWAIWEGTGGGVTPTPPTPPTPGGGSEFTEGFEGGLNGWNVLTVNADGGEWLHSSEQPYGYDYSELAHTGTGFAICYSFVDYTGAFDTDSYLYTPQKYSIVDGSTLTFWADNANDSYPEDFSVCVATADNPTAADFTQVWSGGAKGTANGGEIVRHQNNRYENWRSHSIDLSAYAGQEVYIAFHDVNYDAYEIWIDDVELGVVNKGNRAPISYKMMLDGHYVGETQYPFFQFDVTGMEEGETHVGSVAPLFVSGMGDWVDYEWTYTACSNFAGVTAINGTANDHTVTVNWTLPGGGVTPPGGGDTFEEGFENGLPSDWSVVDANNDGYTWCLTSAIPSTWTYYASLTLDWYRTGTNAICSGSYINGAGALNPDEYLVMGQHNLGAGSTLSFWAAATDASYPADHFGVCVSDDASNWTMVNEWTLTAKEGAAQGGRESRNGNGAKLGSWHEFTADLSAYAGNKYIAIRHFNCYDQYIMCVDDITLGIANKGVRSNRDMWDLVGSFTGTSAGQQGVATDGQYIYTVSWQPAPTGGHTFYQYDLEGNFIEGFEIAGATQIRDLTSDGEYFYGTSGGTQIYCMDFNTRTLVGTINCSGLTSRHISYDPERDGFWSGNWSTLALYSRTGALIQNGPAPTSAYGSAYYKDADGVEHLFLFCQPNSDCKVYDYNITTGTLGTDVVLDFSSTAPGCTGIAGGCFIGTYAGKTCWFGNSQQDPNLIAIYELDGDAPVPPTPVEGILGAYLFRYDQDGHEQMIKFFDANTTTYTETLEESGIYTYDVRVVYGGDYDVTYYAMSCGDAVDVEILESIAENEVVNSIYPNPTSGDLHINAEGMTHVTVFNAMGQMVYDQAVNGDAMVMNMGQYEAGVYMVRIDTENGSSVKRITVVK